MRENTTLSYFILLLHKAHAKPAGKGLTEVVLTHCGHTTLTKTWKEENKMDTVLRKELTLTYDPRENLQWAHYPNRAVGLKYTHTARPPNSSQDVSPWKGMPHASVYSWTHKSGRCALAGKVSQCDETHKPRLLSSPTLVYTDYLVTSHRTALCDKQGTNISGDVKYACSLLPLVHLYDLILQKYSLKKNLKMNTQGCLLQSF